MTGLQIYDRDFRCIEQIEYAESVLWTRKYYDIGTFEIYVPATPEAAKALQREYYVRNLVADDMAGIIKRVEYKLNEDGILYITASGVSAVFLLSQRCLDGGADENEIENQRIGDPKKGLKRWLDRCCLSPSNKKRRLPMLRWLDSSAVNTTMSASGGWGNLWDKTQEVLKEYQVGIREQIDWTAKTGQFGIGLYEGKNRTSMQYCNVPVVFSEDVQTMAPYETYVDSTEYANVAYVAGEKNETTKTRTARITGLVSNTASGIDRCELYVDARDLQKKDEWTSAKYTNKLVQRGREKLQETALVREVSGGADMTKYRYRVDYDVGDKVSLDTRFGVRAIVRVTEVKEIWDENGYTVEPTFGDVGIIVGGDEIMAANLTILADDLDFKSGTQEVPGIENYTCLLFYLNGASASDNGNRIPIPVMRNTLDSQESAPDEVLRGGNNFVSSGGSMYMFAVNCSINGSKVDYVNSGCVNVTAGSKFERRSIKKIVGVY